MITPIKFLLTKLLFKNALFVMFVILEITWPLASFIYILMANVALLLNIVQKVHVRKLY